MPDSEINLLTKEERKTIAYNAREILADRIRLAPNRENTAATMLQYEATVQSLEDCLSEIRSIVWERFADYTGDPLFVALSVAFEKHDAHHGHSYQPCVAIQ